jgi:phenylacetate-coenzyme A ligase PaaK-like adenylate-forming protein
LQVVFVVADNGHFMTRKIAEPVLRIPFVSVNILSIFEEDLDEKINKIKPQILHIYPSHLEDILGDLEINPVIITTGSERLNKKLRKRVEEKFKCIVIETYGCSECVLIASSCKLGNLHVHEDICILEEIKGKTYLTNLINDFSPIYRYEMTDEIEYIDCLCGEKGQAIVVSGRSDDILYFVDVFGRRRKENPISLEVLLLSIAFPFSYQLIHTSQNYLLIYIKCRKEDYNSIQDMLEKNLLSYFESKLIDIKIQIEYNANFVKGKNGKRKQILNKI